MAAGPRALCMKRAALSSKIAEERQERQSVGRHRRTFEGALIIVGIATISAVMFVLF
jgi:hypothetical protein